MANLKNKHVGDVHVIGNITASGTIGNQPQVYVDGTLVTQTMIRRYYNGVLAGGAGIVSVFLTSNGLTKSGANTFLYNTVIAGSGTGKTILTIDERPIMCGFNYNIATGLAQWAFNESKLTGVLIGGNV